MKLSLWLEAEGLTFTAFADVLGVSAETVRRYAAGERIPTIDIMRRIFAETGRQVSADDFYGLRGGA